MITLKCDDRTLSTSIPGNKGVTVSKQMADNSGILQTKEFTYSITVPRTIDSIQFINYARRRRVTLYDGDTVLVDNGKLLIQQEGRDKDYVLNIYIPQAEREFSNGELNLSDLPACTADISAATTAQQVIDITNNQQGKVYAPLVLYGLLPKTNKTPANIFDQGNVITSFELFPPVMQLWQIVELQQKACGLRQEGNARSMLSKFYMTYGRQEPPTVQSKVLNTLKVSGTYTDGNVYSGSSTSASSWSGWYRVRPYNHDFGSNNKATADMITDEQILTYCRQTLDNTNIKYVCRMYKELPPTDSNRQFQTVQIIANPMYQAANGTFHILLNLQFYYQNCKLGGTGIEFRENNYTGNRMMSGAFITYNSAYKDMQFENTVLQNDLLCLDEVSRLNKIVDPGGLLSGYFERSNGIISIKKSGWYRCLLHVPYGKCDNESATTKQEITNNWKNWEGGGFVKRLGKTVTTNTSTGATQTVSFGNGQHISVLLRRVENKQYSTTPGRYKDYPYNKRTDEDEQERVYCAVPGKTMFKDPDSTTTEKELICALHWGNPVNMCGIKTDDGSIISTYEFKDEGVTADSAIPCNPIVMQDIETAEIAGGRRMIYQSNDLNDITNYNTKRKVDGGQWEGCNTLLSRTSGLSANSQEVSDNGTTRTFWGNVSAVVWLKEGDMVECVLQRNNCSAPQSFAYNLLNNNSDKPYVGIQCIPQMSYNIELELISDDPAWTRMVDGNTLSYTYNVTSPQSGAVLPVIDYTKYLPDMKADSFTEQLKKMFNLTYTVQDKTLTVSLPIPEKPSILDIVHPIDAYDYEEVVQDTEQFPTLEEWSEAKGYSTYTGKRTTNKLPFAEPYFMSMWFFCPPATVPESESSSYPIQAGVQDKAVQVLTKASVWDYNDTDYVYEENIKEYTTGATPTVVGVQEAGLAFTNQIYLTRDIYTEVEGDIYPTFSQDEVRQYTSLKASITTAEFQNIHNCRVRHAGRLYDIKSVTYNTQSQIASFILY